MRSYLENICKFSSYSIDWIANIPNNNYLCYACMMLYTIDAYVYVMCTCINVVCLGEMFTFIIITSGC